MASGDSGGEPSGESFQGVSSSISSIYPVSLPSRHSVLCEARIGRKVQEESIAFVEMLRGTSADPPICEGDG